MRFFKEVTKQDADNGLKGVLKIKSSTPFTKDIHVVEVTEAEAPAESVFTPKEIEQAVKLYLDNSQIVNERAMLGKIYADGLTGRTKML